MNIPQHDLEQLLKEAGAEHRRESCPGDLAADVAARLESSPRPRRAGRYALAALAVVLVAVAALVALESGKTPSPDTRFTRAPLSSLADLPALPADMPRLQRPKSPSLSGFPFTIPGRPRTADPIAPGVTPVVERSET